MLPRYNVGLLTSLCLCAAASSAPAAVTLQSAELTSSSGVLPRGGTAQVTNTTAPFPNDANKFATVDADGLRVGVDNLVGFADNIPGNLILSQWNDQGFRVVFDLDEPAAFTYHRGAGAGQGSVLLLAEGQTQPVFLSFLAGDFPGPLAPGHYTFTADTAAASGVPPGFSGGSQIHDVRFSVLVPEPTALAPLAALLLCLRRRRSGQTG